MEDQQIINLFWQRDDTAIRECQTRFGPYCRKIAMNILHSPEDSEECVNDTWLRAWNTIPPEKPRRLSAYLGRITRNLAIDRYRKKNSIKNKSGEMLLCLEELSECIGEDPAIADHIALKDLLERFLSDLSEKNQQIFLLRYFYFLPIREIADRYDMTDRAVKMLIQRIRKELHEYLEKEGVSI